MLILSTAFDGICQIHQILLKATLAFTMKLMKFIGCLVQTQWSIGLSVQCLGVVVFAISVWRGGLICLCSVKLAIFVKTISYWYSKNIYSHFACVTLPIEDYRMVGQISCDVNAILLIFHKTPFVIKEPF